MKIEFKYSFIIKKMLMVYIINASIDNIFIINV